jgi:hypothetical protein
VQRSNRRIFVRVRGDYDLLAPACIGARARCVLVRPAVVISRIHDGLHPSRSTRRRHRLLGPVNRGRHRDRARGGLLAVHARLGGGCARQLAA